MNFRLSQMLYEPSYNFCSGGTSPRFATWQKSFWVLSQQCHTAVICIVRGSWIARCCCPGREDDGPVTAERHLRSPDEDFSSGRHAPCIRQLYSLQSHWLGFQVLFACLFFLHWAQLVILRRPWCWVTPALSGRRTCCSSCSPISSGIQVIPSSGVLRWSTGLESHRLKAELPVRKVKPLLLSLPLAPLLLFACRESLLPSDRSGVSVY